LEVPSSNGPSVAVKEGKKKGTFDGRKVGRGKEIGPQKKMVSAKEKIRLWNDVLRRGKGVLLMGGGSWMDLKKNMRRRPTGPKMPFLGKQRNERFSEK